MKKNHKSLFVLLVFFLLILSAQYWLVGMNDEIKESNFTLSKVAFETDLYKFGYNKNNDFLMIFNDKYINGVITGIIQQGNEIYFSVDLQKKQGTIEDGGKISNVFFYSLYQNTPSKMVEFEKNIPQFGLLSNSSIVFYTRDDLKTLPTKKQEQFIDILNNHHFIFQGKK